MELSSLIVSIAVLCSLPAALVLVGVLAQRPSSGAWLRKNARAFAWLAAVGWGAVSVWNWMAPDEPSLMALFVSLGSMICMTAFAMLHSPREEPGA